MKEPLRRGLARSLATALGATLAVAIAVAPLAALWGVGHARTEDYLGPHRVTVAADFHGEVEIDLGPIGNAYLVSPVAPVGVTITVGGVGAAGGNLDALFSEQTLAAYASLYTDPAESIRGIVSELVADAVREAVKAEAVLLVCFAGWRLRRQLFAPGVSRQLTTRRAVAVYLAVMVIVVGSIATPAQPSGTRIPVTLASDTRFSSLSVDSALLAQLLDRGLKGIRLLAGRQVAATQAYVERADRDLSAQVLQLPTPAPGESLILGFSDLHCNRATTALLGRLVQLTSPRLIVSAGDDTVNGTAAERGCIQREAAIASARVGSDQPPIPFAVAGGNHDSDITEAQMRGARAVVLDGQPVMAAGLRVLGDDDPEHNIPFSVERVRDRPESEEDMGRRLADVARAQGGVDVVAVHQPLAAREVIAQPDPAAALVIWGHFHSEQGPTVVTHGDGTWTVAMQQGTAGGVREPIFTSFSTPFSPPLISADSYFYFRDDRTGLITGVQAVHFLPDGAVRIGPRTVTGDLAGLSRGGLPPEGAGDGAGGR